MIEFNCYPDGKRHIVTFSYDDAPFEDYKLVEIFNKYGIKGTFHLIGSTLQDKNYGVNAEDIKTLYKGHEVAVHTENHPWLEKCANTTVINEVMENRKRIEKECGYTVRGMSYPYGTYNDDVINALKACGIVYSRTAGETMNFNLPIDWYRWTGTCHHNNADKCITKFLEGVDNRWCSYCLYIWGHAFEFTRNEEKGFSYIEEQCARLAKYKDKIWFATNIEIYDYIQAQKSLQIAADESFVYNPTQIDVTIVKDGVITEIKAGQTVNF